MAPLTPDCAHEAGMPDDGGDGPAVGEVAGKDPRGRTVGMLIDRTRTADATTRHAARAAWLASSGLFQSVVQYTTRHHRPEDSEAGDGFASDWLLITDFKEGVGAQKASWGSDEAADADSARERSQGSAAPQRAYRLASTAALLAAVLCVLVSGAGGSTWAQETGRGAVGETVPSVLVIERSLR